MTAAAASATAAASSAGASDRRFLAYPLCGRSLEQSGRLPDPGRSALQEACGNPNTPDPRPPDRSYQAPGAMPPSAVLLSGHEPTGEPAAHPDLSVCCAGLEPARQIVAPAGVVFADVAAALHAELGARPLECAELLRSG